MLKTDLYMANGQKTGQVELPREIFGAKINTQLMAQAVRVYLSNQRKARAKVKTRAEVRGSGKKIWRQKGTGRARHGDRYAPIFVGGGKAHGPTGQENYRLKLSKKMRRLALFSALASKYSDKEVLVVDGLEKLEPKTKAIVKLLAKISGQKSDERWLLVLPKRIENLARSIQNLQTVKSIPTNLLNTYRVLNGGKLIFTSESLGLLKSTWLEPVAKKSAKDSSEEKTSKGHK